MNSLKHNENKYENMEEEIRIKQNHEAHLIPFIILLTKPLMLESEMLNCGFRVHIYCGPLVTSTGVKMLMDQHSLHDLLVFSTIYCCTSVC